VTVFGSTATTLTGIIVPSAWNIWVIPTLRPISPMLIGSHLDFDVDARCQRESHQGVDRLRRGLQDVDEPLVSADLELLPAVLVDERRPEDGETSRCGSGSGTGPTTSAPVRWAVSTICAAD